MSTHLATNEKGQLVGQFFQFCFLNGKLESKSSI